MAGLRFLADENIEKGIVNHLLAAGYDIKWVRESVPAASDERVTQLARKEKRILITNDKDFGELTFMQRRISSGIILFRLKGQSVVEKIRLLDELLRVHQERLVSHFVVMTKKKIRFIPMGGVQ